LDTYHVVLYVHFLSVFIGLGAASVLMACLFRLRASETLADAAPWGMMAGKIGRAFPVAVLGLFATGAYMTSDVWSWSTGWIVVSIVGLAIVAIQGPLIAERTGHKLGAALMANGPGPLGPEARRMTRHPGLWVVEFTNVALVLGIVEHDAEAVDGERDPDPRRRIRRGPRDRVLVDARAGGGAGYRG